jgi:ribose 5-phosphate isomerase B
MTYAGIPQDRERPTEIFSATTESCFILIESGCSKGGCRMQIVLASDHAGFEYKERLKVLLIESGHRVADYGTHSSDPVDYPAYIRPAAEAVAAGEFDRGIVLGGSGNGEAMVANRVPGIRCALCWNVESARLAREHNNSNVLSLGQRMLEFEEALAIVDCWLETAFAGGRHLRRIRQIDRPSTSMAAKASSGEFPHRTPLLEEARYICDACREEFQLTIDSFEGKSQQLLEKCPICCHENLILVEMDESGALTIRGDQHING